MVKHRVVLLANNYLVFVSHNLCSNYSVKPHIFSTELQSDIGLSEIVAQIDTLLPQLANFINKFNTTVTFNEILRLILSVLLIAYMEYTYLIHITGVIVVVFFSKVNIFTFTKLSIIGLYLGIISLFP